MNNYLLILDAVRAISSSSQIEALLANHRSVDSWMRPYEGCYLIKSETELASELMKTLDGFFAQNGFMIVKIGYGSETVDGRADKAFWQLLYKGMVDESAAKRALTGDA